MAKPSNQRRYTEPFEKHDSAKQPRAACAYIQDQANANLHTAEEVRTIKIRVRRAVKALGIDLPTPSRSSGLAPGN